jgi:DNA-binding transcriptional LysR family regulator
MSDRLQQLTAFVRTTESGSFSRAARELGLTQPSISRIVSELEARLGVTLLLRSTRRVTPTDAGLVFLERAKQVLLDLESAEGAARGIDSLRGLIRVALPVTFGVREVVPRLPSFLERHPELRLELVMSDDRQDLIAEGADVAIRLGELGDSGFGARRLIELRRYVVAAPGYLAARGIPVTPTELPSHDLIVGPGVASRSGWAFTRDGAAISVEVSARIRTNTAEGAMACVRAGLGIAIASEGMARDDLASGLVVAILGGYALAPVAVHAVFPAGPRPSAKVRALVDHLAASFKGGVHA